MKRTIELDGVIYSLSFQDLVNVSHGCFNTIDLNNHCNSLTVMEAAREMLIDKFSNSEQQWNNYSLSVFYVDPNGKLNDNIPF
uniref:Uncharacterized protein n=1 Tax=Roseihalotalea indica TaxID=2867963 RepID=A0AA49GPU9_9BACT|nr:hypothetical protein K4G66_22000 [Tunicatimonas sp. TK19036]